MRELRSASDSCVHVAHLKVSTLEELPKGESETDATTCSIGKSQLIEIAMQ